MSEIQILQWITDLKKELILDSRDEIDKENINDEIEILEKVLNE